MWDNWQVVEAYKFVTWVTNLSNFHDKVFGRMWIEANNLSDPDAREFALDALVQAHQHPDSRS